MTSHEPRARSSPALLVAAFVAYSAAHLANNTLLQRAAPRTALLELQSASGGWIEPVLLRSQVVLAAFLVVVLVFGRRRPADFGWRARDVVPGVLTWAGAWLVLQVGLLGAVLAQGVELAWHPMWTRFGIGTVLGGVLAQALGHALVEDTAFRGFFYPELRARLLRPGSALAGALLIALAVLGSALLFGFAHLPTRLLAKGSGLSELVLEQGHFLSAGLALGVAYLATRSLFAVVGLHVLLNDPAPLLDVPGTVLNRAVLVVFGGVVVLAWLRRRRARRLAAEPEREAERRAA